MERLAPRYRVLAPDSYGAGKSPDWHSDRVIALADEVALIEPLLTQAQEPVVLAGHSYGAAVALIAALLHPRRVRALALYEPTLFSVVDGPSSHEAEGIRDAVSRSAAALDRGDLDAAAEAFIDYWMGERSWAAMPPQRQAPIAQSCRNVRRWAHALTNEATPLSAFAAIDVPVLYMVGGRSPHAAQAVAQRLLPVLPHARTLRFEALGHMAPLTDADVVNAAIERFLDNLPPPRAA